MIRIRRTNIFWKELFCTTQNKVEYVSVYLKLAKKHGEQSMIYFDCFHKQ